MAIKSVISGREIPKGLQGIQGLRSGFHIPDAQATRLVVTGMPGSGKSTFLNSNPQALILDPEQGGDTVADPQAIRFTPPTSVTPDELDRAYVDLVDRVVNQAIKSSRDIKMIVIDSLDEFIDIFLTALCLRKGVSDPIDLKDGSGNGYTIVRKDIFGMLDRIHRAGLGWALVAHTRCRIIRIGGEDRQQYGLAVSDSFKTATFQKCEHMLFVEHGIEQIEEPSKVRIIKGRRIESKSKTTTKQVRKLRTRPGGLWQGSETADVKVRVPLPNEIVLPASGGWDRFVAAYNDACATLTATKEN
jgi:energy-coupling factor transporter ATP-binding protein EcfA2